VPALETPGRPEPESSGVEPGSVPAEAIDQPQASPGAAPVSESADVVDPRDAAAGTSAPTPTVRRKGRRVTTEPVPGTDPTPAPEPSRSSGTENDARLKADKPPHWG